MFKCDNCEAEFESQDEYEEHECVWFCTQCCLVFHYKHVFENHLRSKKHLNCVKKVSFECEYCNKTFSSKQSKMRHYENCKYKPQYIVNSKCIVCHMDVSSMNVDSQIKHVKSHNISKESLDILLNSKNEPTQNIYNIHNPTNCNIGNVTTTNNIVIFGNEDFSYIDKKDIQEALKTKNALPRLCRLMRRNPNHPENRNIKVTDFSRGRTQIFTENGWEPAQPIDTFNNMIMEASDILDNTSQQSKMNALLLQKVDQITDNVHELDMAIDKGEDTQWGKQSRREIMLEFVD